MTLADEVETKPQQAKQERHKLDFMIINAHMMVPLRRFITDYVENVSNSLGIQIIPQYRHDHYFFDVKEPTEENYPYGAVIWTHAGVSGGYSILKNVKRLSEQRSDLRFMVRLEMYKANEASFDSQEFYEFYSHVWESEFDPINPVVPVFEDDLFTFFDTNPHADDEERFKLYVMKLLELRSQK